jgi:hypothetical protein
MAAAIVLPLLWLRGLAWALPLGGGLLLLSAPVAVLLEPAEMTPADAGWWAATRVKVEALWAEESLVGRVGVLCELPMVVLVTGWLAFGGLVVRALRIR